MALSTVMAEASTEHWVFGYGSLIWRPGFAWAEKRPGYIRGYQRCFWQSSTDHRGVPGAPGRVVTLIEKAQAICWGVAYRLEPSQASEILDQLDIRERGGYSRHYVRVHTTPPIASALVYVGTEDNPNFAGDAPLEVIATQIARAHGPSGANRDYLLELDAALTSMGADDRHVHKLADLVRQLEQKGQ